MIGRVIETCGVGVIVAGVAWSFTTYVRTLSSRPLGDAPYLALRRDLGRSVLLGLEVLVAGDIIRTVASHPTLTNVAVLGGVVLIRTFLSVTIDTEVNGRWPWQERRAGDAQSISEPFRNAAWTEDSCPRVATPSLGKSRYR